MQNLRLADVLSNELEDFLLSVETSYGIRFFGDELAHLETSGQLFDHIKKKIELEHSDSCTTQQAFYKLRESIELAIGINKESIRPETLLAAILPKATRRKHITEIEKLLGFKLGILAPTQIVVINLLFLFIVSVVFIIFDKRIGLFGLVLSILGFWLAAKTGTELELKTVGELAEKISTEQYVKSRRHPETFNEKEVEKVFLKLFQDKVESINFSKTDWV